MTDIDDVVVVSTGQSLRLFMTIIVLLAIGTGAYLLTSGDNQDPPNQSSPETTTTETKSVNPQDTSKSKDEHLQAVKEVEQDTADAANVAPLPEMTEMSVGQVSLFEEAARWSDEQEWSTASRVYDRIIEDEEVNIQVQAKAQQLKSAVNEEAENLKRLERIKEIEVNESKEAILTAVLPTENSVYFAQAQKALTQIREAKVASLIERFENNLADKAWALAEQDLSDMQRFGLDADAHLQYEGKLTKSRQEAIRKRKQNRKKSKGKSKKPLKGLTKEVQRSALTKPEGAKSDQGGSAKVSKQTAMFKLLEDAYRTNPAGRKNILKKLCDLSDAKGTVSKAIKYCSEHLPNETNKMLKNALERKIERWKKRAK